MDEVIILAGGLGTRLEGLSEDLPKVMMDVNGIPFLQHLLNYYTTQPIGKVVLAVGHRHEVVRRHFGNRYQSLELTYSIETTPLGTGGALKLALSRIEGQRLFAVNGDTYFAIDLARLDYEHESSGADMTLALKSMQNFDRYGTVQYNEEGQITGFEEKGPCDQGVVNGGTYAINKPWFHNLDLPQTFSLERDVLEARISMDRFHGILFEDYFIDIGIPEDLERCVAYFAQSENR